MWVAAWAGLAVGVVLSAIAIALPLRSLMPVARGARRSLVAGVCVGLVAWAAGNASRELWALLVRFTFESVAAVLRLAGQAVTTRPDEFELGVGEFTVTIAPSCSGYEGIGLIVVFLGVFLWTDRGALRFPRAWLLLPLGVAAMLAANVLRIAVLILVGRWVSPRIAEGGFHSKAGWVLFCAVALGLVAVARRSRLFAREGMGEVEKTSNPTAVYLMPLVALLATILVSGLAVVDFDALYPLRPIAVAAVLWAYRDALPLRGVRFAATPILLGALVFCTWMLLEPRADAQQVAAWRQHLASMAPSASFAWLGFRVLGSVVFVPIAEELAFRGYLLRRLVAADFTAVSASTYTWPALLLSSVAFGALHQRWLAGTIAGLCFGAAQIRGGRLEDAVLAHAIANALIAADVLLFGSWWLWM